MSAVATRPRANLDILRELASLLRPWRGLVAVIALLIAGAAAVQSTPPLIVRQIVDAHLTIGQPAGLLTLALLYLAATAGGQALTFAYGYVAAVVAQGALHALRVRLFAHFQELPVAYYDRTPLGDSISRCTADVETVDTLFSTGVATLLGNMVLVVTAGAAMIALSPPLALVSALVLPPLLAVTRFFQVRVREAERTNRTAVGLVTAHLQESLGGVDVIRAFGRETYFVQRFRRALHGSVLASNRSNVYSALYTPTTVILSALVIALLLWAGTTTLVTSWGISIGTLAGFILLFQRFFTPITNLGDQWQTVQSALAGAERIFHILSLPVETSSAAATSAAENTPPIEIQDLVFGYADGQPVVRGVSLAVRPGEQVAVVGRTGAGKTSMLHLLAGLYQPWGGSVRLLGQDPRSLSPDERRRVVGVVPQAVQLFGGSIRDNLTLHDPSVPLADVETAARTAGIHDLVQSLPEGYDTVLGGAGRGAGTQLSAGQQQLLALARALVWNPQVILLDEATSAVDSASDLAFQAALRDVVRSQDKAVLTIAHRLSTARNADRVIVMDSGRIVEEGSPDELVRRGGRFAALLELEASGWDWRSAPSSNGASMQHDRRTS